ncbi:MAG: hypothetical protein LBQ22_09200 [Bacteroidales bacterium]|jgi:hypothetical protein|nr:hypothetical protein [Bacteroidales bacterium]
MRKILQKIANTLVLYSYHIDNIGFVNGKMGIVFFLYHYARYTDNEYYNSYADDLFDEILASVGSVPVNFENGLIGIGWATDYLIKNEFVEGNSNEVLQKVDSRVFSQSNIFNSHFIFGQGNYFISRLNSNIPDSENKANDILNHYYNYLKENKIILPLCHLNSILYFIIHINQLYPYNKKLNQLLRLIPDKVENTLNNTSFDNNDLLVFNKLVSIMDTNLEDLIQLTNYNTVGEIVNTVENFITQTWLNILYFDNDRNFTISFPSVESIHKFVDDRQKSLTIKDFTFMQGLAGVGLAIIKHNGYANPSISDKIFKK